MALTRTYHKERVECIFSSARLIGDLLQTSEMLSLRKVCIDDFGAGTVVPGKDHSVLEELLGGFSDSDLVVSNVKNHELHEVPLGLDFTSGL